MIMTMVKMVVMMLMMLTWQSDGYLNVPPLHGDPSGDDDDAIHGSPSSVIRLVNPSDYLLGSPTMWKPNFSLSVAGSPNGFQNAW